jgi:phage repressor protein C with HTH and peptisase S24 domain
LHAGYFAPVYESVSAGTGKYAYGEAIDFLPVPETVKKSGNIVYFRVSGDSMEPEIRHGSYVLVKEGVMPENGQEGVFVLEEEWFVKVYRRIGTTVILSSINREYRDIEIEAAEGINFKCIGKVAGVFNFK